MDEKKKYLIQNGALYLDTYGPESWDLEWVADKRKAMRMSERSVNLRFPLVKKQWPSVVIVEA